MGKVVLKQGFLGMGRPIVKWYCDKCGVECQNQFYSEPHMYCRTCANAIDPNIVHMWSKNDIVREYMGINFFTDTTDGLEKLVECCNDCLGLLVAIKTATTFQHHYYQLGTTQATSKVFPCLKHSGYSERGDVKIQGTCEHGFIVVGTSKRLDKEAHLKYERMMSERNRMVESMFGTDSVEIACHCFGITHFWCHKCGLHYSLNPQREHLLPKRGLIIT